MPPRFYCPAPLATGQSLELPAGAARHAQVLRLQPGARITLFNGAGGEFEALVEHMGRSQVRVLIAQHRPLEREAQREVQLVVGMPANERMDWLVEKATELGVAGIQPLVAERSVLKLKGERAARKQAHWQGIAIAACEQCGRNRVPAVREVLDFSEWMAAMQAERRDEEAARWLDDGGGVIELVVMAGCSTGRLRGGLHGCGIKSGMTGFTQRLRQLAVEAAQARIAGHVERAR